MAGLFDAVRHWTEEAVKDVGKWTEGAAKDVGNWTEGAVKDVGNWTEGAAKDVGKWTEGAVDDVGTWTQGAAKDVGNWTEGAAKDVQGAAKDVGDWTEGAAKDVVNWTGGAAKDVGNWTEGAVDDVGNWLKGAAGWVREAADAFGLEAAKAAKAVVDAFSKDGAGTKLVEQIPGLGLVIAGLHWRAGNKDQAWRAIAVNVNALLTLTGSLVGAAVAGPGGAMIGGALGKTVGLLAQEAIAKLIKDDKMRAEVGDLSATQFIFEVALAGAASAGAGAVGSALATEAGYNCVVAFASSQTLAALLAKLPGYLVGKANSA